MWSGVGASVEWCRDQCGVVCVGKLSNGNKLNNTISG